MKFATLALALLLAVGSQAVPLQADAPPMLAHVRSVADMYMENLKTSLINAVNQVEDPAMRDKVVAHLQSTFDKITAARHTVAPMTDAAIGTFMDTTAEIRSRVESDIEALKAELKPMEERLRETVLKHLEEYKTLLGPIFDEYQAKHIEEMTALRAKMEPIMQALQDKIVVNVEETKGALIPILDAVRGKVHGWMSNVKEAAGPYVTEYKDQLQELVSKLRNINPEELEALKTKVTPMGQEIAEKLQGIVAAASEVIMKA